MTNDNSTRQPGFTLLELLVVMLIIGIVLTFAVLSIGDGRQKALEQEAWRLHAMLNLALEETVMDGQEIGVLFGNEDYRFLVFENSEWHALAGDSLLRRRKLPKGVRFELSIEGSPLVDMSRQQEIPQVVLFSSGEITPFTCTLSAGRDTGVYTLIGKLNGVLALESLDR